MQPTIAIAAQATVKASGRTFWIPPTGRPFWTDTTVPLSDEEIALYLGELSHEPPHGP